jgi:hypothetical protein
MGPAPSASLLWTLIDVALCRYSVLHPIYYLVESTLLMCLNISMGILSIMFYKCVTTAPGSFATDADVYTSWDYNASWVPGIFILIAGIV